MHVPRLSSKASLLHVILGHSWEQFVSPMWFFAASSIPLYPVLIARILANQDGIWKHITQAAVSKNKTDICYGLFFTFVIPRKQCIVSHVCACWQDWYIQKSLTVFHKLMVVSVFYIMGASATFMLGILLSLDDHFLRNYFMLEKAQTVPMFSGAIISVFFYVGDMLTNISPLKATPIAQRTNVAC